MDSGGAELFAYLRDCFIDTQNRYDLQFLVTIVKTCLCYFIKADPFGNEFMDTADEVLYSARWSGRYCVRCLELSVIGLFLSVFDKNEFSFMIIGSDEPCNKDIVLATMNKILNCVN